MSAKEKDDNGDHVPRVGVVRNSHIDRALRMELVDISQIIVGWTTLADSISLPRFFSFSPRLPP